MLMSCTVEIAAAMAISFTAKVQREREGERGCHWTPAASNADHNCIAEKRVKHPPPPHPEPLFSFSLSVHIFSLVPPPPPPSHTTTDSLFFPFSPLFVCAICPLSRRNVSAEATECAEQIGGRAWTMEHAPLLGHSSSSTGSCGRVRGRERERERRGEKSEETL